MASGADENLVIYFMWPYIPRTATNVLLHSDRLCNYSCRVQLVDASLEGQPHSHTRSESGHYGKVSVALCRNACRTNQIAALR